MFSLTRASADSPLLTTAPVVLALTTVVEAILFDSVGEVPGAGVADVLVFAGEQAIVKFNAISSADRNLIFDKMIFSLNPKMVLRVKLQPI